MGLYDNLISWWKLDEASGAAIDSHGANNLTTYGAHTMGAGKIGGTRIFNGSNSQYDLPDTPSLSIGDIDCSFSFWFNAASLGGEHAIIEKFAGGSYEFRITQMLDGRLRFLVSSDGSGMTACDTDLPFAIGNWHFAVFWHDSVANTLNIQVNGGVVKTVAHVGGIFNGTSPFKIGGSLTALWWHGLIDEVGFWKRALTAAERTYLYNGGAGVSYEQLGEFGIKITTTAVPDAMLGTPYSFEIKKQGGDGAVSFVLMADEGPMPPGLTLSPAGVISGTPTTAGSYTFTVRATDSGTIPAFDEQVLTLEVSAYDGLIAYGAKGGANTGPYQVTTDPINTFGVRLLVVAVSGYGNPISMGDSRGNVFVSLPEYVDPTSTDRVRLFYCIDPLSMDNHTFTGYGQFPSIAVLGFEDSVAVFQAQTGTGTGPQPGNITPAEADFLFVTAAALIDATFSDPQVDSGFEIAAESPWVASTQIGIAAAYKKQNAAKSENPTWAKSPGVPWTAAPVAQVAFKLAVQIVTTSLPNGTLFVYYEQPITVTGGAPANKFSIESGQLPLGLSLDADDGTVFGIPSANGLYDFTVRYEAANSIFDVQAFSIQITSYTGPPRFPDPTITNILWEHFNRLPTNFTPVTISHTYEDEGRSFNETTTTPAMRWEVHFSGLSFEEMCVFDVFADFVRLTVPFSFRDKYGVIHDGVRVESYQRSHPANRSWNHRVEFVLVKYP